MRLLIFSPSYPPRIGGLESHTDEFNKHLAKKNIFQITVFTPRLPSNTKENEFLNKKIKIIRFPAFEIIPNYPLPKFWTLKFWKLLFYLHRQNFDIVISRTRFFVSSFVALIYAKTTSKKFIHIEHGSDFVKLSSKFKSLIAKAYDYTVGRLIFKYSDLNISISQAVQKFIYKFDKRTSPIIYRGLDMKQIEKISNNKKIVNEYPDKIIITFAGRLYKWKGVDQIIKAINTLPPSYQKKIIFLIIGNGEDFVQLKKIAKNNPVIKFLGNQSREKTIGFLKSSQIYIHSAYPGGGLSTSLLEAMYCRNAIIATPNEGAKEVISDNVNGLLIPNNQPALIKAKLIDLINNPVKIKKFSGSAHKYIKENFSWEKSIQKYEKEFAKIMAGG
jgi:glycosyltransferase involved in cell wall biosynthesis